MSQETAPEQEAGMPLPATAPKGLLQQMEELMASLNADLAGLDADLQSSGGRSLVRGEPDPVS